MTAGGAVPGIAPPPGNRKQMKSKLMAVFRSSLGI